MNRPNSTPFPDSEPERDPDSPRLASDSAPALSAGQTSGQSAPLRGEIFDASGLLTNRDGELNTLKTWHGGWLAAGAALLFCTYSLGAYVGQKSKAPAPIGPFTTQKSSGPPIVIQIGGRVKHPGVYSLKNGARLQDALQKAGGALPGADLDALNLADWAADGSKIEIPSHQKAKPQVTPTPTIIIKEVFVTPPQNVPDAVPAPEVASEVVPPIATVQTRSGAPTKRVPKAPKPSDGLPHALTKSGAPSSKVSPEYLQKHPVNLNTATAEQLEVLPGIGPAMSGRILAYRAENGGFKSVDELDSVKGIGEKRMEKLTPLVRVK